MATAAGTAAKCDKLIFLGERIETPERQASPPPLIQEVPMTTTATTLDRIASDLAERRQAAHDAYRSLVRCVATGHDPDVSDAADTLAAFDKTGDDLAADVKRLTDRLHAAALLAELPRREQEAATAASVVRKLIVTRDEAVARMDADIRAAETSARKSREMVHECDAARQALERSADPALIARRKALEAERGRLLAKVSDLTGGIRHLNRIADTALHPLPEIKGDWPPDRQNVERVRAKRERENAKIEAARRERDRRRAELAAAKERVAAIETALAELESAMLTP
jgi:chromosome segregation ATPase